MHKRGDEHNVTPHAMAQGGDVVARIDGMACFVSGALPGEQVHVAITDVQKNFLKADVVTILTPSPVRIPPRLADAPHMEWQHIENTAQRDFKAQILHEQLTYLGKLAAIPAVVQRPASPPWHYRNTAHLHGYGTYLGYKSDKRAHVTEVADDPLLHPVLQEAVTALRNVVRAHQLPARTPWQATLRVSETTGAVVAAFDELPNRDAIAVRAAWVAACPAVVGVRMPYGVYEGDDTITETHYGLTLHLGAKTFFQVSLAAARALCDAVIAGLGPTVAEWRILDAYCGAGTFTLPLAQRAQRVIGIEEYAPAVDNAMHNAHINGLENVAWYTAPVEKAISQISDIDAVVLDPPRRGCHPEAVHGILALSPQRIVYVSCHPGTLARDVQVLVAGGYRVTSVTSVDCFPQTAHVESVTVLERTV